MLDFIMNNEKFENILYGVGGFLLAYAAKHILDLTALRFLKDRLARRSKAKARKRAMAIIDQFNWHLRVSGDSKLLLHYWGRRVTTINSFFTAACSSLIILYITFIGDLPQESRGIAMYAFIMVIFGACIYMTTNVDLGMSSMRDPAYSEEAEYEKTKKRLSELLQGAKIDDTETENLIGKIQFKKPASVSTPVVTEEQRRYEIVAKMLDLSSDPNKNS
jgi:hypothetical protein